jgi:hypothetical protein
MKNSFVQSLVRALLPLMSSGVNTVVVRGKTVLRQFGSGGKIGDGL